MGNIAKNALVWFVIILVTMLVFNAFSDSASGTKIIFSDFLSKVQTGEVNDVTIRGKQIEGHYKTGQSFNTFAPDYPKLVETLQENGVQFNVTPLENGMTTFMSIIAAWFPILIIVAIWIFFMKQMQGGKGGGGAMGFGKSRAKMLNEKTGRKTFDDVAGIDEAKEELEEIVDFLKDPSKFQKLGGKIPRGVLLSGPPGTGKTLLARAIAGEAQVPFFTISGSDFVEMFVGVGASRVRDMFEQGRKNAPCIIFIDEIDAVGRHRGAGHGGGNDEREQTLNQLLVEMDGFEGHEGVIIVAATNRPDVLDPALLRPGRFDRQVTVPNPDVKGREHILNIHMRVVPIGPDVEPNIIARGTPGFSGADLANLVNEAALLAARRNKKIVTMKEMEDAKDKVMMGAERRSMVMSDEEKELTAYHEAGHALVGLDLPPCDPIHKATIIPRGQALGMVMRLPEKDQLSITREKMKADIAMAMGGRVAEELIFGHEKVTSGASSDIKYATNMARNMVERWGMSDKVGTVYHGGADDPYGYAPGGSAGMSEETANKIDSEVKLLVQEGNDLATKILTDRNKDLHTLAKALLEYETLSGDEINDVLAGKDIDKKGSNDNDKPSAGKPKSALPHVGKASTGKKKTPSKKKDDKPPVDGTPEGV